MKQILFIDEDSFFSRVLAQLLDQLSYSVTEAHDGTEGIGLYRNDPSDLVMVDLFMPEGEGLKVIRDFKTEFPDVRLIALSGNDTGKGKNSLSKARRLGARHTFHKPFDTEELLRTIQEELDLSC